MYRGREGGGAGLRAPLAAAGGDQQGADPGHQGGPALQPRLLPPRQHDDLRGGQLDRAQERQAQEILKI